MWIENLPADRFHAHPLPALSTRERRKPCYERTGEKEKYKGYQDKEHEYDIWRCDFAADGYRLPTEAEWEYAARTGSTSEFFYGSDEDLLTQYAWFVTNFNTRSWPGGGKLPNAWGLFDIHGNMWEWCSDWYGSYSADPVSDPTGPVSKVAGYDRVLRGGGINSSATFCRSASRNEFNPVFRLDFNGFRVCCGR
jgi:formylglycine-generating enzyme required for sulfatase activity